MDKYYIFGVIIAIILFAITTSITDFFSPSCIMRWITEPFETRVEKVCFFNRNSMEEYFSYIETPFAYTLLKSNQTEFNETKYFGVSSVEVVQRKPFFNLSSGNISLSASSIVSSVDNSSKSS